MRFSFSCCRASNSLHCAFLLEAFRPYMSDHLFDHDFLLKLAVGWYSVVVPKACRPYRPKLINENACAGKHASESCGLLLRSATISTFMLESVRYSISALTGEPFLVLRTFPVGGAYLLCLEARALSEVELICF